MYSGPIHVTKANILKSYYHDITGCIKIVHWQKQRRNYTIEDGQELEEKHSMHFQAFMFATRLKLF